MYVYDKTRCESIYNITQNQPFQIEQIRIFVKIIASYSNKLGNDYILKVKEVKALLTNGTTYLAGYFGADNAQSLLEFFPVYNYYDNLHIYSSIISNCSTNSSLSAGFLKKYCQFNYSQVILKGEFGTLLKDIIQMWQLINRDNNSDFEAFTLKQKIAQKLFYLDSLNLRLQELVMMKVDLLFQSLIQLGMDYGETKILILMVSIIWGFFCFVLGLRVILCMKKKYFQEIFMITFLNNEMIVKNKRVESFITQIAKNTFP